MRFITLPLPTAVTAMLVFALIAPAADAASPASTAEADRKKPSCKRNAKREALNRGRPRGAAGVAASRARAKKCKDLVKTYRGTTSQGERIEIKTRTTELGTKLISGKLRLTFDVKHMCTYGNGGPPTPISDRFETISYGLKGRTFKFTTPSFDAEYVYRASVTGKIGATTASGQASVTGDVAGQCAATSFSFNVPRVRDGSGF